MQTTALLIFRLLLLAQLVLTGGSAPSSAIIHIGTTKQLLHDDFIVGSLRGATRRTRTLSPRVVIRPDAPWEAGFQISPSGGVVKEKNGTVRLWYELHNASTSGSSSGVPAIAISTDDGATFSKPQLGLRQQGEHKTTNWLRGNSMENCVQNVWMDPTAVTPQYYGTCEDASSGEIALSASRDGLAWEDHARWNFNGNADTRTQILWDSWIGRYVMFTRNWYFLPDALGRPPNKTGAPTWALPSFRRVRRLESTTLESEGDLSKAPFAPLKLGTCVTARQRGLLPRDGSPEWRQMFLGPGEGEAASCWGCPYTDQCISVEKCSYSAAEQQIVGLQIPRGPQDAGTPGVIPAPGCRGSGAFAPTMQWALNGTAFVNLHSGLCMQALSMAVGASLVQAPCDGANILQRWASNASTGALRLVVGANTTAAAAAAAAPTHDLCLQSPEVPGHDGRPEGALSVYGLPAGEETPTNEPPKPWANQTIVLEADAHDNRSFPNLSPPANRGNGAVVDFYGAMVWPQDNGPEAQGGRLYFMLPERFWHHNLPCSGPRGSQCAPAVFDVPVLASRDGVNFSYVDEQRTPLVRPAPGGHWNSNVRAQACLHPCLCLF
eukprot:COSAG05_NODE_1991_length_3734_cov_3.674828_1_plen_606_part_00